MHDSNAEAALIPVKRVCIVWQNAPDWGCITGVWVLDEDDVLQEGSEAQAIFRRPGTSNTGAANSHWMDRRDRTPEGIFRMLLVEIGFADSLVAQAAIAEFAKIDTCGWARAMVPLQETRKPIWRAKAIEEDDTANVAPPAGDDGPQG